MDQQEDWDGEAWEDGDPGEEWWMSECGYMPRHGLCRAAGSEFCDFDCPLRAEMERAARSNE